MRALDEVITSRRSVGKVHSDPVGAQTLRELLELATWAPNHHLTEPWRFIVLTGDARRSLGTAHARAYARTHTTATSETIAREAARLERAPAVIVAVVHPSANDPVTRREDRDAVAAAVQNLLLAAHARGLGAIWRTGTMAHEHEVRDALGLDEPDEIVAFIYVGVPAVGTPARRRRTVDEVTEWRGGP